jgi:hypothetical protein
MTFAPAKDNLRITPAIPRCIQVINIHATQILKCASRAAEKTAAVTTT